VVIDVEVGKIRRKIRENNHGQLPRQRKRKLLLPPFINFLLQRAKVDKSLTILDKSIKNLLVLISIVLLSHLRKALLVLTTQTQTFKRLHVKTIYMRLIFH